MVSGGAAALTASAGESSSITIYFTSWSSNTKSLVSSSTSGAMYLETPGVFETQINITSECRGLVLQKNIAGKFYLSVVCDAIN